MSILIGTEHGLWHLPEDTSDQRDQSVTAVSGEWALVGEHQLVSLARDVQTELDTPRAWCVLDGGETVYVGTAEARLFAGPSATADLAPVDSFDRIETRDEWYTPWGAPPDTRSLAAGPDGTLFVNVHVGGVWWGRPSARWTEVISVDADTHQVTTGGDDTTVVAAAAVGFGRSLDGGATWEWTDEGLHGSYCRAVAVAGDTAFVTASTGPGSRRGAIYRRPLRDDGAFEKCAGGLPEWFPFNLDTFQLAADGDEVVVGTSDGRIYRSADAGSSWELVTDNLPAVHTVTIR